MRTSKIPLTLFNHSALVGIKNIISLHQGKNPEVTHLKKFILRQLTDKFKDSVPPYKASLANMDGVRSYDNFEW